MCGRYGLFAELANLAEELGFPPHPALSGYRLSWNIAPYASVLVVSTPSASKRMECRAGECRPPSHALSSRPLFNARAEPPIRNPVPRGLRKRLRP